MRCFALLLLVSVAAGQEAELAAAVDLPTPKERRKAALALAGNKAISIEAWLMLARNFRPRNPPPPGSGSATVPLQVEGKVEQTEITWYAPESYRHAKPAPLLITLHGAGGDGRHEPARWRDVADALGMVVIAPSEAVEAGGYAFTRRERTAALAALRWARRAFNIDENRIHLTGISRGGHLTWDLGLRHPDRFATLSPMIGGPRLETRAGQNNLRYLGNVAGVPIRDLQGEGDDPRMLFNLRLAFETLKKLGATDAELLTFPGMAHAFRIEAVEWPTFLGTARRDPDAPRVVRLCADTREGRAHWVEITHLDRSVRESFTLSVNANIWNALDDGGRRRYWLKEAVQRTARLEVAREEPGRFVAKGSGVKRFRLLLARRMFDPEQPVTLTWRGRVLSKKIRPSVKVLLLDFVERFDRTYLPVGLFSVP